MNALLYAPIALVVGVFMSVELAVLGAMVFVGLSSIPDFDRHFDNNMNTHRSDMWTLVPIKHRGFTHTVWFAVAAGGVGAVIGVVMAPMASAVPVEFVMVFLALCAFAGILGHILGDMMTPMGVKPFAPVKKTKYSLAWFLAKNRIANYGFLVIGGCALLAAFGAGFSETGFDLGM